MTIAIILGIAVVSIIAAIKLAIYFKYFTPDDFSMWNNLWFDKNPDKDQSYLDK